MPAPAGHIQNQGAAAAANHVVNRNTRRRDVGQWSGKTLPFRLTAKVFTNRSLPPTVAVRHAGSRAGENLQGMCLSRPERTPRPAGRHATFPRAERDHRTAEGPRHHGANVQVHGLLSFGCESNVMFRPQSRYSRYSTRRLEARILRATATSRAIASTRAAADGKTISSRNRSMK